MRVCQPLPDMGGGFSFAVIRRKPVMGTRPNRRGGYEGAAREKNLGLTLYHEFRPSPPRSKEQPMHEAWPLGG